MVAFTVGALLPLLTITLSPETSAALGHRALGGRGARPHRLGQRPARATGRSAGPSSATSSAGCSPWASPTSSARSSAPPSAERVLHEAGARPRGDPRPGCSASPSPILVVTLAAVGLGGGRRLRRHPGAERAQPRGASRPRSWPTSSPAIPMDQVVPSRPRGTATSCCRYSARRAGARHLGHRRPTPRSRPCGRRRASPRASEVPAIAGVDADALRAWSRGGPPARTASRWSRSSPTRCTSRRARSRRRVLRGLAGRAAGPRHHDGAGALGGRGRADPGGADARPARRHRRAHDRRPGRRTRPPATSSPGSATR